MALALVPHVATAAGSVHVWVGVADVRPAPALAWTLDGAPIAPRALRPLTQVPAGAAPSRVVYTGAFEVTGLTPRKAHKVGITAGNEHIERWITPPPAVVPDDPNDQFNLLLLSCFHQHEDKGGKAGDVLSAIGVRPDITVFAGDQVYLDLPTLANFKDDDDWLRNKFQNDYLVNWFGDAVARPDPTTVPPGYPTVLNLAPALFMPDDHEYWNNYPFAATVIENSWSPAGRARWAAAANAMYQAFQENPASPMGVARVVEFAPLSILMLDTRSQRSIDSRDHDADLLSAAGRAALEQWTTRLIEHAQDPVPLFGMLVTGQSYFSPAASAAKGAIEDYEYANYKPDYAFMVEQVERLTAAGLPILLATGDVHWGRVLSAMDPVRPSALVFEVISSPTAMVESVGVDQIKQVLGTLKGLFGRPDPFPRHGDPSPAPSRFGRQGQYMPHVGVRTGSDKPTAMRGDQAFMLRFTRAGTGLNVDITCYPMSGEPTFDAAEQWSTTLELRPPK
ncbi:MAG TPA: alkaline phosphatase D family protein [Methylomirabilota bacterium]|jgi:hypothetical protein|nr:alkaline phosphatase D family protein [Methylomirabilota bacterium]